jgi:hypothetical protein
MENNRIDEARKIVKEMDEDINLKRAEELIRDNKIQFEYKEKQYRVRMLNLKEKEELDMLRRKKFGQLIQDKDILLEKDLIKVLKTRDIDVDKINDDIKKLEVGELDLQMKLGESISKNEDEIILKRYKDQIEEIRIKKAILDTQKTLILEFSLENQLLNYISQIITYLSADILEDGIWRRMFNSLVEFQSYSDESLINRAGQMSMILQYI